VSTGGSDPNRPLNSVLSPHAEEAAGLRAKHGKLGRRGGMLPPGHRVVGLGQEAPMTLSRGSGVVSSSGSDGQRLERAHQPRCGRAADPGVAGGVADDAGDGDRGADRVVAVD
jgi:hypothetical protein